MTVILISLYSLLSTTTPYLLQASREPWHLSRTFSP